ncbi:uncharacterized protein LOC134254355 [Saccostrea cucullata]|uniref:uncharacterized protein LOC134254355 n=1 Tax=Saccostrea cuccullata TaxID=36930 RepID=UPI002ED6123D
MKTAVGISVVLSLWGTVTSHLCLVTPTQRGEMDIHQSGSSTCFRHGAPCGGENPTQGPYETYTGGQQVFIKWLQNFNHYEIGYPGYMDVSLAPYNTDDWQVLAFAPDEYVYNQDHQQNYTAFVVLPNKACEHCVLRARYESHKPGEQTFYQCADITIKESPNLSPKVSEPVTALLQHTEYQRAFKKYSVITKDAVNDVNYDVALRGFAYSPFDPNTLLIVNVTLDGSIHPFGKFDMRVDLHINKNKDKTKDSLITNKLVKKRTLSPSFILDSLVTVNNWNNLVVMYNAVGDYDKPTPMLAEFDTHQGTMSSSQIEGFDGSPINALLSNQDDSYYTFSIEDAGQKGYNFVVGQLYLIKNTLPYHFRKLISSGPEPLYVNYQWAELDVERQLLFVLMGNENTPDKLLAKLYTYDINKKNLSSIVDLEVSMYAYMNFHYYRKTGMLYAVSPGMFYTLGYPFYSLIEINPATGKITRSFRFADWGYFRGYFGGAVFGGLDQDTGILYHVMTMQDTNSEVIASIDVNSGKVTYSQMTNLKHVHNLALTNNKFRQT